jgi:hypothetical protein
MLAPGRLGQGAHGVADCPGVQGGRSLGVAMPPGLMLADWSAGPKAIEFGSRWREWIGGELEVQDAQYDSLEAGILMK